MKYLFLFILLSAIGFNSAAQFAPSAGQIGTTAIHKDSSIFVAWATGCTIIRGYQDISNTGLGYASAGDSSMALGVAGSNGVVSLGDGGYAIITIDNPIKNGISWDFAVFENSFSDTYLELSFVEVSSDGINFFRFPATSNTQDTVQVGSFDTLDATQINNFAGKYRGLYGTPFDLQELVGQSGLDVNNITHVKIVDVVGSLQNAYASYDQNNNKINDPWSTPFASSGFDLDALGVINQVVAGIEEDFAVSSKLTVFPNPIKNRATIQYYLDKKSDANISIVDVTGKNVYLLQQENNKPGWQQITITDLCIKNGIYFLKIETTNGMVVQKIIIANE